ncbi:MAG: Holliday junction resolvase RuvX [Bergeyella sp.]|nr:Holliday junction resolvase RuvX [Bergeyella sp.]
MGQILSIDYGRARCGIAATDDAKIIASGLDTVKTGDLMEFLRRYVREHLVDTIVVGYPMDLRGNISEIERDILSFIEKLKIEFPAIDLRRYDERFTSKIAAYYISQSGKSKKKRQEKSLVDKVSATLILQNYLEYIKR